MSGRRCVSRKIYHNEEKDHACGPIQLYTQSLWEGDSYRRCVSRKKYHNEGSFTHKVNGRMSRRGCVIRNEYHNKMNECDKLCPLLLYNENVIKSDYFGNK